MAMSQRTSSINRGGRGGFNPTGRQRQRQLPQPRPFRPPATPPPPSEEAFQPKRETEELQHSPSFILRLLLPGFTRLEEVKITKTTTPESDHAVRVQGERFDPQTNKRFRFDTTFAISPEYDISPPIDAKLDSGVLTVTFPKFSSSSSSSSSFNSDEESSPSSSTSSPDQSQAPGFIKSTHDGLLRDEAADTDRRIDHGGDGKTRPVSVEEKLEKEKETKKAVDQETGERASKLPANSESKLPDHMIRAGVGQGQLMVNMGAAVAVVIALGAYTYYFKFA